jgi:murein DD-endopeptidase MepM/ murein hydrolase activator NlpD
MDIPPIIQVAEDTFSQESKNLLFNNTSRNRALRALSAEGLVNNLPQRPRPISSFAEQARGQVTFDTGQPGIDVFFEDKQFPAVLSGTVKEVSSQYNSDGSGYGNYIVIEAIDPATNEPVDVLYGHLAEPAQFNPGDQISEGQVIGTQGGTGSVRSVDGTIASIDFLAPAAPGSVSMTPYRNYDSLRRRIAKDLGFK